ncbi:hypothetical protein ACFY2Y_15590 [Janibacter hoylei]|uniref:hypothetical protein n=1 Tax=Janibacter hoylei TaxID=364298 RepID=UPI00367FCFBB
MKKRNLQAMVPFDHAARVYGTVQGMQRILGSGYTLTRFLIDATEAHCAALEAEHNEGQPWTPAAPGGLAPGARIAASSPSDSSRITKGES